MTSNFSSKNSKRTLVLLLATVGAAIIYGVSLKMQLDSLVANRVGYEYVYSIRKYVIGATFLLMAGIIVWLMMSSKSKFLAVVTAIISISSCAMGFYLFFDSHTNANRILSSDTVLHTEFKRTILIHYTTWLDPKERIEPALAFLEKDDDSIQEDWDKLGFNRQMDMITTYNRKGFIGFRIRDPWMTKTLKDRNVDIDLFLSQALDPHERRDFIRAIALQTDSAKAIIEVSKWGLGAAMLSFLLGITSIIASNRGSDRAASLLSGAVVLVAITMPMIPLTLLSGIVFGLY